MKFLKELLVEDFKIKKIKIPGAQMYKKPVVVKCHDSKRNKIKSCK